MLIFRIPDQTWRVVAQYSELDIPNTAPPDAFVCGIDAERVLVEYWEFRIGKAPDVVELIDSQSGDRTEVLRRPGLLVSGPVLPSLHGDRVYWMNALNQLVVYDIATATQTDFSLEPGAGG